MKGNDAVKFFAVIAVIAILTFLAVNPDGTYVPVFEKTIPSAYDIRQATDLKGGIDAVLYPKDEANPTEKQLKAAKAVIERRLDNQGVMDRVVTIDSQKKRITVQIPLAKGATIENPGNTIKDLGNMAKLTFRAVDETKKDPNTGAYLPVGELILSGDDVDSAEAERDNQKGGANVALKLNSKGTKAFAEATKKYLNKPIAIYMDDKQLTAPNVEAVITNGEAVITGQRNMDEAIKLANEIRSGSIPFALEAKNLNSISPMLGSNALQVGVTAGIVAFILICLFMLVLYRLPGLLACIALLGHTVIQLLFLSWTEITVSLPGIAAIILSIGMGVDANVIIFERVKEELRNGKTLRSAIDVGFKRAFSAVLDANITTLISALVLLYFGTGSIKSFAITLALGVVLSFLTAVTASRIMLRAVAGLDIMKHRWLYGVKGGSQNA